MIIRELCLAVRIYHNDPQPFYTRYLTPLLSRTTYDTKQSQQLGFERQIAL
jgi:hypothetical protein